MPPAAADARLEWMHLLPACARCEEHLVVPLKPHCLDIIVSYLQWSKTVLSERCAEDIIAL
jgi:hypothetical protein